MARPEERKLIYPPGVQPAGPVEQEKPEKKPKKKGDPHLMLLAVQIVICALLVSFAYVVQDARPELLSEVKPAYLKLLSSRAADVKIEEILPPAIREKLTGVKEAANSVVIEFLDDKEPDAQKDGQVTQAQPLDGAGGLFAVEEQRSEAPAGCTYAPILISAAVYTPVSGRVTSLYGYREHPISGLADFHRGVDVAAVQGTRIHAVLPGRVCEVGESPIYGNFIVLDHGGGLRTAYSHCAEILAPQGAVLREGEAVARVGSTGISTGPHVHFEMIKDGEYYDPAWVLEGL